MKITVKLEREDFDAMFDVIFGVKGYEPTDEDIQNIWDKLPDYIQATAIQWGCDDTVFRDELNYWLYQN
jgi:hypothetical protein